MPTADARDLHHGDHVLFDSGQDACPICGGVMADHTRGTVDFYCPEPRDPADGN